MNNDLKNFCIKFFIVLSSLCVVSFGVFAINQLIRSTQERAKIEAHKVAQDYIADMKNICNFAQLHDDEQKNLSDCGDDTEKAKALFISIVEKRIVYWQSEFKDAANEIDRLDNVRKQYIYTWNQSLEDQYNLKRMSVAANAISAQEQVKLFMKSLENIKSWNEIEAMKRIKKEVLKPKNAV